MTIYSKLNIYFENNSKDKIREDWNNTKNYDDINSPTVEEYLKSTNEL